MMTIHKHNFQTLVLNADYQPLSVYPLSRWNWKDAVTALTLDRVVKVAEYDEFIPTPRLKMRYPSIVALKKYLVTEHHSVAFNRYNIWLRDGGKCAYCDCELTTQELTFDHVYPKSLGGPATWENIVCACQACNIEKANKTLAQSGKTLSVTPRKPKPVELALKQRLLTDHQTIHQTWVDYLYWDSQLLSN